MPKKITMTVPRINPNPNILTKNRILSRRMLCREAVIYNLSFDMLIRSLGPEFIPIHFNSNAVL
jgi:hypothetical protein